MEPIGSLITTDIHGQYPSVRFECNYIIYRGRHDKHKEDFVFQAEFRNGDLRVIGNPFSYTTQFSQMGIDDAINSLDEKITTLHRLDEIRNLGFLSEHHALLPRERTT